MHKQNKRIEKMGNKIKSLQKIVNYTWQCYLWENNPTKATATLKKWEKAVAQMIKIENDYCVAIRTFIYS